MQAFLFMFCQGHNEAQRHWGRCLLSAILRIDYRLSRQSRQYQ